MAGEIVYADLSLSHGFPGSRAPLSALPLGPQSPRWHRIALWVGWIGNIVLVIAVIALGIWVSHLVSEKGQSPAAPVSGDPSPAACSTCLERVRSQLCPPAQPGPAGGAGCKLCPMNWQLHGDKCYWVSKESKTWDESRRDCAARGSQLLVMQDPGELVVLQDLTEASAQFWVGLNRPSTEKGWTWLDRSRLDQTRLPVSGLAKGTSCGLVKGNQIGSKSCSSGLRWVCQRDAILL